MYYLLFVGLDGFYAARFEQPPAVVVHYAEAVLDCCGAARARRVLPGTPLSEAKAILRGDARYVEFREQDYREERDRWLEACLLYSSRIEHETPASAWIDLSRHPDPVDIAQRLVSDLWHLGGWPVRAALAPSKWIAKVGATWCDPSALSLGIADLNVVEDASAFLAPLPTRMLAPVPHEHRTRLDLLGYRRIGDVQRAALHLLQGQFGKGALLVHLASTGRLDDPVRPNFPREVIECAKRFDGPCSDRLAITDVVTEIADELTERLRQIDRLAGATETVFELESGSMLRHVRRLPKPSDLLRLSLRFQVDSVRLHEPLQGLRVTIPDLRCVSSRQRTIDGRGDAEVDAAASVRELQAMYGDESVKKGSLIELPRRRRVLRAWRDANGQR